MTKRKERELLNDIRIIQEKLRELTGYKFHAQFSAYNARTIEEARESGKIIREEFGTPFKTFASGGHEWVRADNNDHKISITIFKK